MIVATQWRSVLMTRRAWFEARYRWFFSSKRCCDSRTKAGSPQFALRLKGTACSPARLTDEREQNGGDAVWNVNTKRASDVKVRTRRLVMQLPLPAFDFLRGRFFVAAVCWKKSSLVRAHKPSIHFSWETVLFSVMGYYNHWAWKAMYDSSFPTPFPLPWPELSRSLGSRNTECKHFSSYSGGNATVSGHSRSFSVVRCLLFILY